MIDETEQNFADLSNPEPIAKLEADENDNENEELKRELTDDEVARIAGGICGTNETHTKTPT